MKKYLILMIFVVLSSCNYAYAQKVEVDQSVIDDCTQAFELVAQQRDALEKFKLERLKTEEERKAADVLIKGLNDLIKIKDLTIGQYQQLVEFQQKIIAFQQQIITQLQDMLKKPKSPFTRFMNGLQKVLVFIGGVLAGRALGL